MEIVSALIDFILHIDEHLGQLISTYGVYVYGILFIIIFIETGLVFTPFLPGDSLLFAAGAFAALGSLNVWVILFSLMAAAILGDTANYWIGHFFGNKILRNRFIPINPEHIAKTNAYFEKHGGKTIFIARFIPIVRTFAPFVAGIGKMNYSRFISYNIFGGISWVAIFTLLGYFLGSVPFVKQHYEFVILFIILISFIPVLAHLVPHQKTPPRKV